MPLQGRPQTEEYESIERQPLPNGLSNLVRGMMFQGRPNSIKGFTSDVTTLQQVALPDIRQLTTVDSFIASDQPGVDLRNFQKSNPNVYSPRQRDWNRNIK